MNGKEKLLHSIMRALEPGWTRNWCIVRLEGCTVIVFAPGERRFEPWDYRCKVFELKGLEMGRA